MLILKYSIFINFFCNRLKKWIAKKAEREAEKLKRRKERLERLKQKPPHMFFDFEYERKISELPERINDALNEGIYY